MDVYLMGLMSAAITCVITTAVGLIIKKSIEKRLDRKEAGRQELENLRAERRRQERKTDVLETLRDELKPLSTKIDDLKSNLEKNTHGTVTLLREDLKQSRDTYVARGSISASELANWHQLCNTYRELGGNHFREYVDEWLADVESLPRPPHA